MFIEVLLKYNIFHKAFDTDYKFKKTPKNQKKILTSYIRLEKLFR